MIGADIALEPSGMPRKAMILFERIIHYYGLTPVGEVETKNGMVYIAERWNQENEVLGSLIPGGYDVLFACRGLMQEIECQPLSTQEERIKCAVKVATDLLESLSFAYHGVKH